MEVIEYNKKHPLISSRKLAEMFVCGRSQIQSILKKKEDIIFEYETNAPAFPKSHRGTHFQQVNEAVLKWYTLARQRNVPISGPMLQDEAQQIAAKLGCSEFKASNGWLESFKCLHNLKTLTISGEADAVSDETVEAWLEQLNVLLKGYKPENMWNMDETSCLYRGLPEKTLVERNRECRGGKNTIFPV